MLRGIVKGRKRDADGNPIGKSNDNPLLDTRLYEVEFPDGNIDNMLPMLLLRVFTPKLTTKDDTIC
jgi:hypothetical protein